MRLGPLTYQSAYDVLRAKGYQPVPGSSRFEDTSGRTGRIVEAEGRGDTWYAEAEEGDADLARVGQPCPECGTAMIDYGAHGTTCPRCAEAEERVLQGEFEENGSGTFAEGFADGRRDREHGLTRQLCTTGTGERPPVVKRQGRDYYHGYKAAAEGATSEPSAYLAYRAKHRGMSGMAANGGSSDMRAGARALVTRQQAAMDRFIDYAMDRAGLSRDEAERALAVYRREKLVRFDAVTGQFNFKHGAFGDADVLQRAARMTGNPVHLKLDGNFSFGIGTEDDKTMKKNAHGKIMRLDRAEVPTGQCACGSGEPAYAFGIEGYEGYVDAERKCARAFIEEAIERGEMYPVGHEPNARHGQFKAPAGLTPAEAFFFGRSGSSYRVGASAAERKRGQVEQAKALARAESEGEARGWTVEWEHDQEADTSWMDEEALSDFRAGSTEMLTAVLKDENGNVLGSLGGVHVNARGGRDPYGRVVEAELMQEALAAEESSGRAMALNAGRGHCRICGETLPPGEVICAHHEREGVSNDPRWADLPSWEEARGRIHGGQHSLVENARRAAESIGAGYPKVRIYDAGADSGMDRYTAVVVDPEWQESVRPGNVPILGFGPGIDQFGEGTEGPGFGRRIAFTDLPETMQRVVLRRLAPREVGHEPNARGSKAWFGNGETNNAYAIKIAGIENDFPLKPLGRQEEWPAVRAFQASARKTWISAKHDRSGGVNTVKRFVKSSPAPDQFYAKWTPGDDSLQIWYTVPEGAEGHEPNWRNMLDLPGVERRLGADRVAAVLSSMTPHAVALGLAGDASDANDVGAYEAYTSLARMVDDGELDDLIRAARARDRA